MSEKTLKQKRINLILILSFLFTRNRKLLFRDLLSKIKGIDYKL